MFKHLTLAFCAGALFTGCVITTGDTTDTLSDSDSNSNTVPMTGGGTTSDVVTTGDSAVGTTGDPSASGTTGETPTTGEPGTAATSDPTATETATDPTATGNVGGGCGWLEADVSYYACEADGGVPGAVDPMGTYPLACPDGLVAGDPCPEEGDPVTDVGCCTADNHAFFCDFDSNTLFDQDCSA